MSLHERPGCACGCGGVWDEPAARRELGDAIARVRLGVWKRPTAASRKRRAGTGTSFEDYALRWLQAKTDGLFGEIAPATAADYRWCIERHLLPIFGDCTVEEIDRARCLRLKARADDPRPHRRRARAPRAPAPRGCPDRSDGLPRAEYARRSHGPRMSRTNPHARQWAGKRAADRQGTAAATEHDAPHAAPHVHLDRAVGERIRREVGYGAGRSCGLANDDGCLRAARAARQAHPWHELRSARAPRPRAARRPGNRCGG
jgi:hypothetical protein